jgi:hypothetical protein
MRRRITTSLGIISLLVVATVTSAAAASAVAASPAAAAATASPPAVGTGAAHDVTYDSATLTGSIAPHGSATSYYFQYGPTKAYGGQTPLAQVAALPVGQSVVAVSAPVSGLLPLTAYHYRLVAVNAAGAKAGADRALTTARVPLSLAILASPNPTIFGGTATIQGTLSGTGNGSVAVLLQANPFPYTQGFATVGNPELTTATGGFSFPFLGITQATQFRVVTPDTKPIVISPVAIEGVAVQVQAHVGRTRRRHHARIYGTVTPAIDGMEVGIMRVLGGGRQQLVAGTILLHHNASSSRFGRVIRVRHRGLYRVFVKVTNGAQTSNYSQPLFIR